VQDLSSASALSNAVAYPGSMTNGTASAGSIDKSESSNGASAAEKAGFIAGGVIAAVLAVAALVALFIFIRRKLTSAHFVVPSVKSTVRFVSESDLFDPEPRSLSSACG
jgi:hypothetical protein